MHPKSTPNIVCEQCGKAFYVKPSRRSERRFCSHACKSENMRGEPGLTPGNVARFWETVDMSGGPDACWPYMGARDPLGYGRFSICQQRHRAHRIAAELEYGPCPDHLRVCHHCDNPPCCNPRHLYYGTAKDNTQDMIRRGRAKFFDLRQLKGETHPNARLSADIVIALRREWGRERFVVADRARDLGITPQGLWAILKHKTWQHLPSVDELMKDSA